jgi:Flp pilus assembly protein CpaB
MSRSLTAGLSIRRLTRGSHGVPRGGTPTLRPRTSTEPPQPSRRAPLRNWATPLRVAGLALVLLAAAGYWLVYSGTTERTPVLVMARDLPAGAVVRAGDVRVGELAGDRAVLAGMVPEQQLDRVVGRRLASSVTGGAPLPRNALTRPIAEVAAYTLTLPAIRTGAVQIGDRVTVLATYGAGSGRARTVVIARGLQVLGLGATSGPINSATTTVPVVLAVPDPSIAADLALSNDAARVSLLLEGSRRNTTRIDPAIERGGS